MLPVHWSDDKEIPTHSQEEWTLLLLISTERTAPPLGLMNTNSLLERQM